MNIVDPILFQCRHHPPGAAICAPGTGIGLISYGRLAQFIHNITRNLRALGLAPGSIVAVYVLDPIFHVAITLALTRLGIVTLSGRQRKFPAELKIDASIADEPLPFLPSDRVVIADQNWINGDGQPIDDQGLPKTAATDICRIVLTSGTTGDAKAVALTHKMLMERNYRHHMIYGPRFHRSSRIYSDLGLSTSLGFLFLIDTLARGGLYFHHGDSFENTLAAFDRYKVQCWLISPSGLATMLRNYEHVGLYQSSLKLIISGGAQVSRTLSDDVRARICSHHVKSYGSTETSVVATAPDHAINHIDGAVGYPLPGTTVQIVGRDGQPLKPGEEGVVRIRSPFSVEGYFADHDQSGSVFRDGWFYPGDFGAITPDNVLLITGRQKSVLSVGGEKFNPETIEAAIGTFPDIEQAAVFGSPDEFGVDQVVAFVVARSRIDKQHLLAHCRDYIPHLAVPADFIVVESIPHNAMGKIDRARLPDLSKTVQLPRN